MTSALYQAFVDVVPSTKGLQGSLSKEFAKAGPGAGRAAGKGIHSGVLGSVGSLAAPLAAAFAALGIGKIVGDSITNASDIAEAGGAISAIFGSSSKSIQSFSKDASAAFGLSQIESLNAAKTFGIFGNAAGLTEDANSAFANQFTGLAADLAAFNNTDSQTAINALGAAFRGESEPMSQFGVLLNQATLKARAMEMGIYDGNGALTSQQKLLATQAEILAQTATQQGNFGDTSSDLAGQQKILETGMTNLSATFGALLLPIMTTVVGFMNDSIIPAFRDVSAWVSENMGLIKGVGLALGVAAGAWLVMTGVLAAFNGIMAIVRAVTLAGSVAQWALNVAMSANPIGIIIVALAALVGGIVWVATQTTFFQDAWQVMVAVFISSIGMFKDFFTNTVGMFADFFTNTAGMAGDFVSNTVGMFADFWSNTTGMFSDGIGNIIGFFTSLPGKVWNAVKGLAGMLTDLGKNMIQGLLDGAGSLLKNIGTFFLDIVPAFIREPFKAALGIHSPSKVFAGFGENITEGLLVGVGRGEGAVDDAMTSLVSVRSLTPRVDASVYGSAHVRDGLGERGSTVPEVKQYITVTDQDPRLLGRQWAREFQREIAG